MPDTNKAELLAIAFGKADRATGEHLGLIEEEKLKEAIYFQIIDDDLCILHDDGSANLIGFEDDGKMTAHNLGAEQILEVLHHYKPFNEVFQNNVHFL